MKDFKVMSFDCYGTLIDWETGILSQLRPFLARREIGVGDAEILRSFGEAESAEEAKAPNDVYPEILRRVHVRVAADLGADPDPAAAAEFGDSVGGWPPFSDSHIALAELKERFRLVILSNVDNGSFARSERQLGVSFDAVYTAEDIGSYKPDPRNFDYLLNAERDAGYERDDILHVAQSLYHDHVPGSAAGLTTCWVQRPSPAGEHGATREPETMPAIELHFTSLADLAAAVRV